jgi:hypothetical protein
MFPLGREHFDLSSFFPILVERYHDPLLSVVIQTSKGYLDPVSEFLQPWTERVNSRMACPSLRREGFPTFLSVSS